MDHSRLIREIEEDIRRDRHTHLWQHIGKIMVGISIAIVLATIAIVVLKNRKEEHAQAFTTGFIKGVDRYQTGNYQAAVTQFDALTKDPSAPYYSLAMLRKAQAQEKSGDQAAAAATYRALEKNTSVFGQLAAMHWPQGNASLRAPAKDSVFYYTQSEWNGWENLRAGNRDEAVSQFISLVRNPRTPYSMQDRLTRSVQHLSPGKLAEAATAPQKEAAHD